MATQRCWLVCPIILDAYLSTSSHTGCRLSLCGLEYGAENPVFAEDAGAPRHASGPSDEELATNGYWESSLRQAAGWFMARGFAAHEVGKVMQVWPEHCISVIDEVDWVLHRLKSELNFPMGKMRIGSRHRSDSRCPCSCCRHSWPRPRTRNRARRSSWR